MVADAPICEDGSVAVAHHGFAIRRSIEIDMIFRDLERRLSYFAALVEGISLILRVLAGIMFFSTRPSRVNSTERGEQLEPSLSGRVR
jgi:hypothetical protein